MKLEKIDERLLLFPQYLHAKLNQFRPIITTANVDYNPKEMLRLFNESGYLMVSSDDDRPTHSYISVYSFDEWLFEMQHYDLVDYSVYSKPTEGLIDHVKKRGRTVVLGADDDSWYKKLWADSDPVADAVVKAGGIGNTMLNKFFLPAWLAKSNEIPWIDRPKIKARYDGYTMNYMWPFNI